jgi:hypothetical protein
MPDSIIGHCFDKLKEENCENVARKSEWERSHDTYGVDSVYHRSTDRGIRACHGDFNGVG